MRDNAIQLAAEAAFHLWGWPQAAAFHQKITKTKQNINQKWWNQELKGGFGDILLITCHNDSI